MLLTRSQVSELDDRKVREFLGRRHSEGHYLDYKRALSGDTEREQRLEFLQDVTSFANALGGHIIIGTAEPMENQSIDDQLVGVTDGDRLAEDLEHVVRDSTEPLIPGFFIQPVSLNSGKWVLVVHVPPSSVRPHMVNFSGRRSFYVRRHTRSEPMTVYELRDSFLFAATAEGRAKEKMAQRTADAVRYFQAGATILFLQAVPMVNVEEPWPVEGEAILSIARGSDRRQRYRAISLATQYGPKLTIDGVFATNNPERNDRVWEIHRSGYVSVLVRIEERTEGLEHPAVVLHYGYHDPFFVLAEILEKCWHVTGFDAPYAMSAELFPAKGSVFARGPSFIDITEPYFRDEIVWPIYMRQPGQAAQDIARSQIVNLYHAYDETPPTRIDPPA